LRMHQRRPTTIAFPFELTPLPPFVLFLQVIPAGVIRVKGSQFI
jgi:hypothetical protein